MLRLFSFSRLSMVVIIFRSELLHVGEVLGVLDALDYSVSVFDMFGVYVDSGVEDVL